MQYNPYTEFVTDMVGTIDRYKKQGRDKTQTLVKKINNSVYGVNIRRHVNNQYICVTENWMSYNQYSRFKEWFPMKNGDLLVKLKDDVGVDDQDIAKSNNEIFCQLGSFRLGQSKRLLNNVVREGNGFYIKNIYYVITDSAYIHENIG